MADELKPRVCRECGAKKRHEFSEGGVACVQFDCNAIEYESGARLENLVCAKRQRAALLARAEAAEEKLEKVQEYTGEVRAGFCKSRVCSQCAAVHTALLPIGKIIEGGE